MSRKLEKSKARHEDPLRTSERKCRCEAECSKATINSPGPVYDVPSAVPA